MEQEPAPREDGAHEPVFRSGAVARMAQMPVATLRIWEQRYQAVRPKTAPSGHRHYSRADVQRVMVLRQLTQQGHAIGTLAGLDFEQLQALARPAQAAAARPVRRTAPLRLVVVGPALAARLQRPAVARRLGCPLRLLAVHETLDEAGRAAPGAAACDLLLWQTPGLQPDRTRELRTCSQAWQAAATAVVFRFAGTAAKSALQAAGALLLHEPAEDEDLGAWLAALIEAPAAAAAPAPDGGSAPVPPAPTDAPPRRFDDAALTAIAGLSTTLACECPRHVAELLLQLSSFETYSAGCVERSPQDARLHRELQRVAAASRALFEAALEAVARHEGLDLTHTRT